MPWVQTVRPIRLTAHRAMAGRLWLALGIVAGSEPQQPLAVLGGLALARVMSWFLLPALAAGRANAGRA